MNFLNHLYEQLLEHKGAMQWAAVISAVVFVGSLLMVPFLVVRIPADYFAKPHRPRTLFADQHPLLRWSGLIVKNLLGASLLLAGIAMLVLPGQGLLTVAIGVLLLDFPGKHRLEAKLIRFPPVGKSIHWLRKKANAPPLVIENHSPPTSDHQEEPAQCMPRDDPSAT
ncbi:PGPGW domain-containing protein [Rhodopirellula sp. P2]|uniref:PGPGW domain-containing protein n=1 Tax=Rhodopirellula sp. P2 TaxID=2127060 RepID=UPI0023686FA1|nr:PGPGW domain-containing protein [Rhodopirellula sp. P2]WDQ17120.1 PGPGW domain-containing protein [Rhodopirellula sp. P2]